MQAGAAALAAAIGAATGAPFELAQTEPLGGGCINEAFRLLGRDGRRYFAKRNRADRAGMFAAEADGLTELAATHAIRVPQPICQHSEGRHAWLVLEYLDLDNRAHAEDLGRQLAALHRTTRPMFGWWRDNAIGATPQPNAEHTDWIAFWREQRLGHQFRLAQQRGARRELLDAIERLLDCLPHFFRAYQPVASLLHGDLWSGNVAYADGQPVLLDPAVYYGDREADLAMTELFGGFPAAFYAAYHETWPLDPGYATRKALYNLYHLLNHDHLFGGGYGSQALQSARKLCVEAGRTA